MNEKEPKRKDWGGCVMAMHVYKYMKEYKIPEPLTCSVSGLEKRAGVQEENCKWLFVEMNPAQRWWPLEDHEMEQLCMKGRESRDFLDRFLLRVRSGWAGMWSDRFRTYAQTGLCICPHRTEDTIHHSSPVTNRLVTNTLTKN